MTNVKCVRCGVVNPLSSEVCKVCGVELLPSFATRLTYRKRRPKSGWNDRTTDTHADLIGPFNGVGDVVWPTLSLFAKNLWLITKIVVVIVAPFEIFKALSLGEIERDWQYSTGMFALGKVCNVLIAPALIHALTRVVQTGIAPGVSESYRDGVTTLWKLSVCAALAWLLQGIGLLLLVVPGIFIALALELVYPIAVLEKRSISDTLRRSYDLTRGHRWKILGAIIVSLFITAVMSLPVRAVLPEDSPVVPLSVVGAIIRDILSQIPTVLSLVIYLSIRALWSEASQ